MGAGEAWAGDGCVKRGESTILSAAKAGAAELWRLKRRSRSSGLSQWERTARDVYLEGGIVLQCWAEHGEVKELFAHVPAMTCRHCLSVMAVKENLLSLGLQVVLQFN